MKNVRAAICAFAINMFLLVAVASFADDYTLTILHTNDIHSHLDVDSNGRYGSARVKALADLIKAEKPNNIMVDAGDMLVGTVFYTLFHGEVDKAVLNMMGYDAVTLGNHEFDRGPSVLSAFIDDLRIPVVSSNIDFSGEPLLNGKVIPYYIKGACDYRIGFVGATLTGTPGISSPGETIVFNDVIGSITAAVKQLQAEDVRIIVAITHVGFSQDRAIAAAVDGIDVIVGGHSHSLLSNDEYGISPYPTVVDSPSGNPVLVVHAGSYNKYLGELDVTFNEDGVPVSWSGNPVYLHAGYPLDGDVAAYIADIKEDMLPVIQEVVGHTEVELSRDFNQENTLGNLITDAMLEYMRPHGVQVALTNNGGIRADIPAGDITIGKVMELLPFGNTMATFEIKGSDLWMAFDHGVSRALGEDIDGPGGSRFLHNAGAKVKWDPSLQKFDYKSRTGGRVVSVQIDVNGDGKYVDLDPEATYKIVANNFIRGGGDGYLMFEDKAIDPYDAGPLDLDVLTAYLENHNPVHPAIEGRIVRLQDTAVNSQAPEDFVFGEPSPNPFNLSTTLEYSLPYNSRISLKVYNIGGQCVSTLKDGVEVAGRHSAVFDAANLPSGIYFCTLRAGEVTVTKRMMLLK